jgi:predicted phage terminase large subunit-like protein
MATSQAITRGFDLPEPYDEQKPFMGNTKRYYGFVSGSGAGKTFSGVYRLCLNVSFWNPGENGAIVVPNKNAFTDNIKPVMDKFGLLDRWEYKGPHSDEPGLYPETGERILILGADNVRRIEKDLKGKSLAYIWMDEEAEIDPRAREILIQRLRTGPYPNLFATTTPKGKNHTYDFFYSDNQSNHGQGTLHTQDEKLAIVGVPPEANPSIRDEDIASMRANLPDQIVAQEIEGTFVEIGAGIYEKSMFHFVTPKEIDTDWTLQYLLTVDPANEPDKTKARDNDTDYWAVTFGAYHSAKNELYVLDSAKQRGMTLTEGANWVASMVPTDCRPKVWVEGNQSQKWLQQTLTDVGLNANVVSTSRNKEERLLEMTIPLENGAVKFVNRDIDNQLGYDPRFQDLMQEALAFPEGRHDDSIDSLWLMVDKLSLGSYNIMGSNPVKRGNDE